MKISNPQITLADSRWGELFDERSAIAGAPAFFGPPMIAVLGPWLLLVFLLSGPLALMLTFALAVGLAATALIAGAALIASPYLLIRATPRVSARVFARRPAGARRLGSPQPKGMS